MVVKQIAWVLVIAGSLVVLGFGAYYSIKDFFSEPDIPIAVKVAIPTVIIGLVLLNIAVLKDRLRERKAEDFRKVDR